MNDNYRHKTKEPAKHGRLNVPMAVETALLVLKRTQRGG